MVKWITIILATLGISLAVYAAATEGKGEPEPPPPASPPSINPFAEGIAATGVVESATRNVSLGTPDGGIVTAVLVNVNDTVIAGQELVKLDNRALLAELTTLESQKALAQARLDRLRALPRPQEVAPAQAAVQIAEVAVRDAQDFLDDVLRAGKDAVAQNEISRRTFSLEQAKAELVRTQANLDLVKAGAFKEELAVAQAEVNTVAAQIQALNIRIDRLTIRAPKNATVLKRNIEPGQFAVSSAGTSATGTTPQNAWMVLGDLSSLRVRARIDEEDAPLLRNDAAGFARIRGIANETFPLRMLAIEPMAEPKTTLTGDTRERVDTRVVEVVFEVSTMPKNRLFPGQVVDVFVDIQSVTSEQQPSLQTKTPKGV